MMAFIVVRTDSLGYPIDVLRTAETLDEARLTQRLYSGACRTEVFRRVDAGTPAPLQG